jgi:hypothetical protein
LDTDKKYISSSTKNKCHMKTRKHYLVSGLSWLLLCGAVTFLFQFFVPEKAMFIPALPPFIYGMAELLLGIFYQPELRST